MTYEQVLRSESIRLYIDIGIRDIIDEARLADVGEAGYQDGPCVRVDGGEATEVLTDLQFGVKSLIMSILFNARHVYRVTCHLES